MTAQGTATGTARAPVEPRRAANLAGLLVVDAALAARGAVLGVLVTLVVSSRAPGPVAVTFALTAHQLVVWIAYPWLGRASDRSGTSLGRRTPYLAGGLLVAGAGQMLIPHTGDYWPLVAVLVAVHLGLGTYRAARPAALPESFGRSRWLKALLVTGLVSLVSAAGMRGVAIVTWTDDDPGTWAPAFLTSGGLCVLAGLAVLVLVRQPTRTARPGPEPGAGSRERHHWRRLVAHARAQPNGDLLLAGLVLDAASVGITGRLVTLFFADELGAGGRTQATGGLVSMVVGLTAGWAGLWLVRRVAVRRLVVVVPMTAAAAALATLAVSSYWQAVGLGLVLTPLAVASWLALLPLTVALLPGQVGLGQAAGLLAGPRVAVGVGAAYLVAVAVELSGTYRIIFVLAAALQLAKARVMSRLRLPGGADRLDLARLGRLAGPAMQRQMARSLVRGPLDPVDADTDGVMAAAGSALAGAYTSEADADRAGRHRPRRAARHLSAAAAPQTEVPRPRRQWFRAGSRPGDYRF